MKESSCDVLVVGGGLGGCAAAIAAASLGLRVVMTEETRCIGGQLTSQATPPDEHPWIEQCGCTRRYRRLRERIRSQYRRQTDLLPAFAQNVRLNPGGGWVSGLCCEPQIALHALREMVEIEGAEVRLCRRPLAAHSDHDVVSTVVFSGPHGSETVRAKFVLDATELGELLELSGTEFVTGAESRADTGEPNALDGPAEPSSVQGITWVFAMAHDEGSHRVVDKPDDYERWREYRPPFWPGPLFSLADLDPKTLERRDMPLFAGDWRSWFRYRQILDPAKFQSGRGEHPVTIVNWPMNDYFVRPLIDRDETALSEARTLSLSLLYWLQTECPRPDGGQGYPGLYLRPDLTGADDGLAMAPYVRESRRIRARFTVLEQHVAAYTNPGSDHAPTFKDSVGVGAYRIDLHPDTGGHNYIDTSTLPFQIPLGALIPVRMRNLIPACKNIGTTHITNGCYRLHPVEWNIGEAAGLLAAFCIGNCREPAEVYETEALLEEFQALLTSQGVELSWPQLRAL